MRRGLWVKRTVLSCGADRDPSKALPGSAPGRGSSRGNQYSRVPAWCVRGNPRERPRPALAARALRLALHGRVAPAEGNGDSPG